MTAMPRWYYVGHAGATILYSYMKAVKSTRLEFGKGETVTGEVIEVVTTTRAKRPPGMGLGR